MMSRLMRLVPAKKLLRGFVATALRIMPEERRPTNAFLVWLKDLAEKCAKRDISKGAGGLIRDMTSVGFGFVSEDEAWRRSLLGFIALIRAAPAPPYKKWEKELIEKRYKCEAT